MSINVTLYTKGTRLYCANFIWCVSCTVLVLTFCVMCDFVYVEGFVMCGCFVNMYTRIYCVLYFFTVLFVLFRLCIFILICFVCTSVGTIVTE
jgi:hypothetical protein